jgi:hypothetical protein
MDSGVAVPVAEPPNPPWAAPRARDGNDPPVPFNQTARATASKKRAARRQSQGSIAETTKSSCVVVS